MPGCRLSVLQMSPAEVEEPEEPLAAPEPDAFDEEAAIGARAEAPAANGSVSSAAAAAAVLEAALRRSKSEHPDRSATSATWAQLAGCVISILNLRQFLQFHHSMLQAHQPYLFSQPYPIKTINPCNSVPNLKISSYGY